MKQNFRSGLYSTLLATLLGVVLTTGPRPELGMGMGMGMGGAGDDLAGAWRSQFGQELNKYKSKECSTFFVARTVNSKDEAEVCILPRPELGMGMGMGMGGGSLWALSAQTPKKKKKTRKKRTKGQSSNTF